MLKRALLSCLLALGLPLAAPQKAWAGDQDFHLFNRTGVDLHKVYVGQSSSGEWDEGDDLLQGKVLMNGADVMVLFHPKQTARMWDLRVEDDQGHALEWDQIDLVQAEEIILEPNGQARIK